MAAAAADCAADAAAEAVETPLQRTAALEKAVTVGSHTHHVLRPTVPRQLRDEPKALLVAIRGKASLAKARSPGCALDFL